VIIIVIQKKHASKTFKNTKNVGFIHKICINYRMVTNNKNKKVGSDLEREKYIITKKIAKHGKQAVIVIPKVLENKLKPGTIAQINIEVLEEREDE
jgi:hypothetical protein